MIVLRTEVEVAEEDGGFSTRDHQDQEHNEQEPEHIVDLVSPEVGQGQYLRDKMRQSIVRFVFCMNEQKPAQIQKVFYFLAVQCLQFNVCSLRHKTFPVP